MIKTEQGILQTNNTIISFVHRSLDVAMIIISLFGAVWYYEQSWGLQHSAVVAIAALLFHFISEVDKLYISWRGLSLYKELKKTLIDWGLATGILFLCTNLFAVQYLVPKSIELAWLATGALLLVSYRIVLRFTLSLLRGRGFNTRKVVIAGAGQLGNNLAKSIQTNSSLGLVFNGYYDDHKSGDGSVATPIRGNLDQLVKDCKNGVTDRVYITLPMRAEKRIKWLMRELADTTASVYLVPDIFVFELLHARSDVINGIPTISIYDSPLDGSNAIIKRIEDIVLSSIILVLISPVMLALAIAVKVTSSGSVFFKQTRYGMDGKAIKVWKFRSMTVMENGAKVTQAKKNDSRLTPIGRFIRSTSLDELPQFINVLQGRMSIVGPRPHAVVHNEEYRRLINGYMLRHKVKPGITGWAQINGWRGETDTLEKMEKRIEYDLDYIRNWSLAFDIKIVISTVFKSFIDKNAY